MSVRVGRQKFNMSSENPTSSNQDSRPEEICTGFVPRMSNRFEFEHPVQSPIAHEPRGVVATETKKNRGDLKHNFRAYCSLPLMTPDEVNEVDRSSGRPDTPRCDDDMEVSEEETSDKESEEPDDTEKTKETSDKESKELDVTEETKETSGKESKELDNTEETKETSHKESKELDDTKKMNGCDAMETAGTKRAAATPLEDSVDAHPPLVKHKRSEYTSEQTYILEKLTEEFSRQQKKKVEWEGNETRSLENIAELTRQLDIEKNRNHKMTKELATEQNRNQQMQKEIEDLKMQLEKMNMARPYQHVSGDTFVCDILSHQSG